ncbi:hypothetical protein JCM11641_003412 [Rhodosporidiobolus odoratus]
MNRQSTDRVDTSATLSSVFQAGVFVCHLLNTAVNALSDPSTSLPHLPDHPAVVRSDFEKLQFIFHGPMVTAGYALHHAQNHGSHRLDPGSAGRGLPVLTRETTTRRGAEARYWQERVPMRVGYVSTYLVVAALDRQRARQPLHPVSAFEAIKLVALQELLRPPHFEPEEGEPSFFELKLVHNALGCGNTGIWHEDCRVEQFRYMPDILTHSRNRELDLFHTHSELLTFATGRHSNVPQGQYSIRLPSPTFEFALLVLTVHQWAQVTPVYNTQAEVLSNPVLQLHIFVCQVDDPRMPAFEVNVTDLIKIAEAPIFGAKFLKAAEWIHQHWENDWPTQQAAMIFSNLDLESLDERPSALSSKAMLSESIRLSVEKVHSWLSVTAEPTMFKRPHTSKTLSPLRSSDLRRLRESLLAAFQSSVSSTAAGKDLAKLLLPDSTLVAKASSHLDEPLTLYFAPASEGGGGSAGKEDCRFFRVGKGNEGQLVPTTYTLDLAPELLPRLETARAVVENLISGSSLFISGVSRRSLSALPAGTKEGDLVAITAESETEDGDEIVAVGTLAASKGELISLQHQGGTGKGAAVYTLHARGDFLWQSGSQVAASPLVEALSSAPSVAALDDPVVAAGETDTPAAVASVSSTLAATSLGPSSSTSDNVSDASSADLTPSEVDLILLRALHLSIQTVLSLPSSASLFPLSASTLYSSYILPFRPSLAKEPRALQAEIKKSGWKKLDKFIKEVSGAGKKKGGKLAGGVGGEGLVQAKEVRGDWVITGVNATHPDVETLRPYRTLAQESAATASSSAAPANNTASSSSAAGTAAVASPQGAGEIEVKEYYKPSSDSVKELLSRVEHERPTNNLYSPPLISSLLKSFTTHFSLNHPRSPSLLLLHPSAHPTPSSLTLDQESAMELLAKVVLEHKKGERAEEFGRDKGRAGCVDRAGAVERLKEGCTKYWTVRRKDGGEGEVKKGSPPVIKVQIKNVGKRQVTLVSGHEAWSVFTSEELAEELKHKSASSTSIQPLAGSAKKGQTPKVEIMCQGTHDALVFRLLTTKYGLPRRYVEVDTSKSKK